MGGLNKQGIGWEIFENLITGGGENLISGEGGFRYNTFFMERFSLNANRTIIDKDKK